MTGRITNSYFFRSVQRDLAASLRSAASAQRQISTGARFEQVSDDPLAGVGVTRANTTARHLEQYRRTVTNLRARIASEEEVVNQLADILDSAREIAIAQSSSTSSALTRAATAQDVQGMIDQVISLGNTRIGNEYLFAGTASDARPFDPAGLAVTPFAAANAYAGDTTVRQLEIDAGYRIDGNITGEQLLLDTDVLENLVALRDALQADDANGIAATIDGFTGSGTSLNVLYSNISTRSLQLDAMDETLTSRDIEVQEQTARLAGVDIEEATVRLAEAQQALQGALYATSRIINTSLLEYL